MRSLVHAFWVVSVLFLLGASVAQAEAPRVRSPNGFRVRQNGGAPAGVLNRRLGRRTTLAARPALRDTAITNTATQTEVTASVATVATQQASYASPPTARSVVKGIRAAAGVAAAVVVAPFVIANSIYDVAAMAVLKGGALIFENSGKILVAAGVAGVVAANM